MESVSIVVPVKDEQDTIHMLVEQIDAVFNKSLVQTATLSDIIFIDDGSSDHTWAAIRSAAEKYPVVKGIRFRRNFGKAAALQEGISCATGGIVVTMDGDLQDDPKEIPRFLEAVRNGDDVVSGWKKTRHDPRGKTIPSKLFNLVTAKVSGVDIHDFNCGFKAYRREVFNDIHLYGELHRFIPALAHATGFKVGEIVVEHHPRRYGRSKYGARRLLKGFLDLLTVVTITRFNSRPGHLFGGIGFLVGLAGFMMLLYLSIAWLGGQAIGGRPLLIVSALLMIVGCQFVLFGMIAELVVSQRIRDTSSGAVLEITPAILQKSGMAKAL